MFLNKINYSKFFYDSYNLENVLTTKNEIFNVPYKLTVKNDKFNKNIFTKFNSKKIRLDIESNTNYDDIVKKGLLDLLFINKNISLDYEIKKNSLNFYSKDKKKLNGLIDFKPFYLEANLNYDGISTKELFKRNSILIDLIKSEIFNSQNLNTNLNINIKDITNFSELNSLYLKISLEQGNITFSDSKIMWKEDLQIFLKDGLIVYDKDEISFLGRLIIDAKNIDNFYRSFQINKNYRKDLKQIEMDFVYNLNTNKFMFDNVKIDKTSSKKLDIFINNYNNTGKIFSNKITFKNFVSNFFINYAG